MKNLVSINNDGTCNVLCKKTDGSTVKVKVDIDSLSTLNKIEGTWSVSSTASDGARPYCMSYIDGKRVYMSRMILGFPDGLEVDHKNGITLDNTRQNLQAITRQQNAAKMTLGDQPYPSSTTGVRNVSLLSSGKYAVTIRQKRIGTFPDLESAKFVADSLRAAINFARLGTTNN
jgi:hypothetical protein